MEFLIIVRCRGYRALDHIRQNSPHKPNTGWPDGYFVILQHLHAPLSRQPFYVHWVRLFFKQMLGKDQRRRDLGLPEVMLFCKVFAATPPWLSGKSRKRRKPWRLLRTMSGYSKVSSRVKLFRSSTASVSNSVLFRFLAGSFDAKCSSRLPS